MVERIANAGAGREFYRFSPGNARPLFIKVLPERRASGLAPAERVALWLRERGAPVVAAISPDPLGLGDGMSFFAYPYVEGRAPEPTESDAAALGDALGRLHGALREHPERPTWEAETARRMERLASVRARLAAGTLRAGPDPEALARLAGDDGIDFLPQAFADLGRPAPSHGDLNIFNILVADEGPLFLDFEDVFHSVLPPAFDVATVLERAVFVTEADGKVVNACTASLMGAYEKAAPAFIGAVERLPDVLQGLALRALCTLTEIDPEALDRPEWLKFFALSDRARRLRPERW